MYLIGITRGTKSTPRQHARQKKFCGQRYVVGEVVTPLSLVKVARPQSIESNVALPVISYLLVEHFPD
jgi:hypothetical protein